MSILAKYAKTAAMSATGRVGESPLFLFDYGLRFLRVAVLLALWRTILAGRGETNGMTLADVLTYTLIAEVFAEQLAASAGLEESFWHGTAANQYLRPLGVFPQAAAEMAGRWAVSLALFSLPLLLAAPLLGVNPLPESGAAFALFGVSLVLAVAVGLALDFLFASLMLYLEMNMWTLGQFRAAVGTLLTGAMLPLPLLPWRLGEILQWLPFASMASSPLRIYTGTGNPAALIAVQAAWAALLWPLAFRLWTASRERVVSYGG
jgi:ABC-2 type transport system permease protein